jgi:hypothetical protein
VKDLHVVVKADRQGMLEERVVRAAQSTIQALLPGTYIVEAPAQRRSGSSMLRLRRCAHAPPAVEFGCAIPFDAIPQLVEDGFRQQEKVFRKGNRSILEHYQTARQCLAESLGDPLCDLMLMLVLTLASSSVTLTVTPTAHEFSPGPKKDRSMFAANLVTRMLWFYKPECFPWDADDGVILRVSEMTKKIGKVSLLKG